MAVEMLIEDSSIAVMEEPAPAAEPATPATKSTKNAEAKSATSAEAKPAATAEPAAHEGPVCEKCQTPFDPKRKTGWCLRCGYYPKIKTFVELDPWDKEVPEQAVAAPEPKIKPIWKYVPAWGWLLIGGCMALFVMSLLVRLLTTEGSTIRTAWSVGQFGVGVLVFMIAHVAGYMYAIMQSDRLTILDIVLRPINIWSFTVKDLPSGFRRAAAGSWGLSAALLAFVVGGIPYDALWDWGGKPQPKKTLVQAITEACKKVDDDNKSLDEAVQDFAGKAGVDDLDKKEKPIERRQTVECLVIGFMPLGEDDFSSLLLATAVGGRLRFVGPVTDGIEPEVRRQLNARMRELQRNAPLVECKLPGVWLEASLVCRVKFKDWSGNHRLNKPLFEALLAELDKN